MENQQEQHHRQNGVVAAQQQEWNPFFIFEYKEHTADFRFKRFVWLCLSVLCYFIFAFAWFLYRKRSLQENKEQIRSYVVVTLQVGVIGFVVLLQWSMTAPPLRIRYRIISVFIRTICWGTQVFGVAYIGAAIKKPTGLLCWTYVAAGTLSLAVLRVLVPRYDFLVPALFAEVAMNQAILKNPELTVAIGAMCMAIYFVQELMDAFWKNQGDDNGPPPPPPPPNGGNGDDQPPGPDGNNGGQGGNGGGARDDIEVGSGTSSSYRSFASASTSSSYRSFASASPNMTPPRRSLEIEIPLARLMQSAVARIASTRARPPDMPAASIGRADDFGFRGGASSSSVIKQPLMTTQTPQFVRRRQWPSASTHVLDQPDFNSVIGSLLSNTYQLVHGRPLFQPAAATSFQTPLTTSTTNLRVLGKRKRSDEEEEEEDAPSSLTRPRKRLCLRLV